MQLNGSVVVVTGGSSGIGWATALAATAAGAEVVIVARDRARLDAAVASAPPEARPRLHPQCLDVRDERSVAEGMDEMCRRFGRIDALVNAAGTSMRARQNLPETSTEDWSLLMETNLTGTYLMCRATLPGMIRARRGEIVNIGSTAGYRSQAGNSLYAASKHGVRALTEALAEENLETGVRVTSVSPGPVDTNIWNRKLQPPNAATRSRMLRAKDIAGIVLWLLALPPGVQVGNLTVTPRAIPEAS